MRFSVIIKIDKDVVSRFFLPNRSNQSGVVWLTAFPPKLETGGPPIERTPAITARIKLRVPMQATINEITSEILRIGPLARGISEDECNIEFAQKIEEFPDEKARMTNFNTIAESPFPLDVIPGAGFQL